MRSPIRRLGGLSLSLLWLSLAIGALHKAEQEKGPTPTPEQTEFFEKRVRPVLATNCFSCHGPSVQMAGLRLDSRAAMLKGGVSGPAVEPGDPEKSLLVEAIRYEGELRMPKGGKLKATEIADLEAWVKMGAPWPAVGAKPLVPGSSHWSFQPVVRPAVPNVKSAQAVRNPIDAFLLAKLEAKGLGFTPETDRRTLLRRLSFDLIGLPPTAAEVDAFLTDKSPNAYEKVVDRLLASPHYGERQARLWMDVARYADTKGYVFEEDRVYHHAYTYRDWLIRAFNRDLPYDQFIVRQLAADRLPEVQNGDDRTDLAAIGFLTLGRRFLNHPPDIIDDRIDVATRGFMGLTVSCARCHDHKFDPIPTQDYYSLYAVFANSAEQLAAISERAVREPWELFNRRVSALEGSIRRVVQAQTKALRTRAAAPESAKDLSGEVKAVLQGLREEVVPEGENLAKLRPAFDRAENDKVAGWMVELAELRKQTPATPEFAMAMQDVPSPKDGYVFGRGNPSINGGPAPRRFLAALTRPGTEREHWKTSGGRLEFAQAIAANENPLTARVFANRVWMQHFGEGLVRTPSDFGIQGDRPDQPLLLDFLASAFVENGWSVKKLHRLIVTSAAYRQGSVVSAAGAKVDPENRLFGRMNRRRLDLEQMRDALVFTAGKLDLTKVGGKSTEIWTEPFSNRRAVYGFIERQNLPGVFRTFDFASPDSTSPRRFRTTVPQQALFLLNSPFSAEQARGVAARADVVGAEDVAKRIRRIYLALFGRLPNPEEAKEGASFLAKASAGPPVPVWLYGYGTIEEVSGRVASFKNLPHFAEGSYRGGAALPDPQLGWVLLNAQGGHPGRGAERAVIRRWTAPSAMALEFSGLLKHPNAQGDGVRARVVSNRNGKLGEWRAQNREARTGIAKIEVAAGETLDFVVDSVTDEGFDGFVWAPVLRDLASGQVWDAAKGFGPPRGAGLSRTALYVQALMMTNEYLFVD